MLVNRGITRRDEMQIDGAYEEMLRTKQNASPNGEAFWAATSLTMSYFHTGIRTIIGAKSFHGPVRDGKEWGQLAMVIRHNWVSS